MDDDARTPAAGRERLAAELAGLREAARTGTLVPAQVAELRVRWLGRKQGVVTDLLARLREVPKEEKAAFGAAVNQLKSEAEAGIDALEVEAREIFALAAERAKAVDVTLPPRAPRVGRLHPLTVVRRRIEAAFRGLGYEVVDGPEVETDWYNFGALNMPPAHPARSMWDTIYVRLGGAEEVLLRTHTSPVQIRVMEARQPPIYTVMPGRCYRRDTLDATHSPMFHQIEGLVVDRGITFADLAGTIEAFTQAYFGTGQHARLRPSYFPFTEPSAEFEVVCYVCGGGGCSVCRGSGWIELGGCGMVDPAVFEAVGYDPEEFTGFAFGFGLERMALNRFGIDHIKAFFENDVRFLEQF